MAAVSTHHLGGGDIITPHFTHIPVHIVCLALWNVRREICSHCRHVTRVTPQSALSQPKYTNGFAGKTASFCPPRFSFSSLLLKAQLEGIQTRLCRGVCTCSHRPGLKSTAAASSQPVSGVVLPAARHCRLHRGWRSHGLGRVRSFQ